MSRGRGLLGMVVTYHPGSDLCANLAALRAQVDELVVVDNGSRDMAVVERAVAATGSRLIANGRNLGIAAALNQGLELDTELIDEFCLENEKSSQRMQAVRPPN